MLILIMPGKVLCQSFIYFTFSDFGSSQNLADIATYYTYIPRLHCIMFILV